MKEIKGDLIELALNGEFDVIGHGCNCKNNMGSGIAVGVKRNFHNAYVADQKTLYGDRDKMGTMSTSEEHGVTVCNLYTQYNYTRDKVDVEYPAVRSCMKLIKENYSGKRIGLPLIGAGRAGGDWGIIKSIIKEELVGEDVTIVHYDKNDDWFKSGRRTR